MCVYGVMNSFKTAILINLTFNNNNTVLDKKKKTARNNTFV